MSLHDVLNTTVTILLWGLYLASLAYVFGPELLKELRVFWARGPLL